MSLERSSPLSYPFGVLGKCGGLAFEAVVRRVVWKGGELVGWRGYHSVWLRANFLLLAFSR